MSVFVYKNEAGKEDYKQRIFKKEINKKESYEKKEVKQKSLKTRRNIRKIISNSDLNFLTQIAAKREIIRKNRVKQKNDTVPLKFDLIFI